MELRLHAGAKDVALYFVHWLTDLVWSLEKSTPPALPSCLWRSCSMVSLTNIPFVLLAFAVLGDFADRILNHGTIPTCKRLFKLASCRWNLGWSWANTTGWLREVCDQISAACAHPGSFYTIDLRKEWLENYWHTLSVWTQVLNSFLQSFKFIEGITSQTETQADFKPWKSNASSVP